MCEVCLVTCRLFVREHNTGLTVSNTEKNTGAVLGAREVVLRSREAADDQYSLIDQTTLSSSILESGLSKEEVEEMYFPLDEQDLPPAVEWCVLPIARQRWSN